MSRDLEMFKSLMLKHDENWFFSVFPESKENRKKYR